MILITGGAGFLGSNLIASLNERGQSDIIITDTMIHPRQWKNLAKRKFSELLVPRQPISLGGVDVVIHLAAITDTTETNQEAVLETNYAASVGILEACCSADIPFIYASSAAVYGNGQQGFSESATDLRPLNLYAWSKLLFDQHVGRRRRLALSSDPQVVGLRFFNVYGPNEYHKGKMASVLCQKYDNLMAGKSETLFVHPDPPALGASLIARDFVYVEDAVNVILWMLDHPEVSGIFNVGTGQARTFDDFLKPLGRNGQIVHEFLPEHLCPAYQFFTQADLTQLREAGCDVPFRPIEEGVRLYVEKYLSQQDRYR